MFILPKIVRSRLRVLCWVGQAPVTSLTSPTPVGLTSDISPLNGDPLHHGNFPPTVFSRANIYYWGFTIYFSNKVAGTTPCHHILIRIRTHHSWDIILPEQMCFRSFWHEMKALTSYGRQPQAPVRLGGGYKQEMQACNCWWKSDKTSLNTTIDRKMWTRITFD